MIIYFDSIGWPWVTAFFLVTATSTNETIGVTLRRALSESSYKLIFCHKWSHDSRLTVIVLENNFTNLSLSNRNPAFFHHIVKISIKLTILILQNSTSMLLETSSRYNYTYIIFRLILNHSLNFYSFLFPSPQGVFLPYKFRYHDIFLYDSKK